jgi:hypothetical protein
MVRWKRTSNGPHAAEHGGHSAEHPFAQAAHELMNSCTDLCLRKARLPLFVFEDPAFRVLTLRAFEGAPVISGLSGAMRVIIIVVLHFEQGGRIIEFG